ncbi:MAG: DUF1819 family protein [Nitrospira sp.]|nr:DUF1819 family protein [Nitrospira sp.]
MSVAVTRPPASEDRAKIPALDPSSELTSRLSARTALYTELRLLLDAAQASEGASYRELVLGQNCLARASASARAKLWKELKARYRLDSDDPLFGAFLQEWRRAGTEAERQLVAFVFFALNDRLVAQVSKEWLCPLLRIAPTALRPDHLAAYLNKLLEGDRKAGAWTQETRARIVRHYLASIRDFGLAKGTVKKESVRPALHGAPIRLLVSALLLAGTPLLQAVQSPAFKILGLEGSEAIDALGELNRQGALKFKMQGDVVELEVGA